MKPASVVFLSILSVATWTLDIARAEEPAITPQENELQVQAKSRDEVTLSPLDLAPRG